MVYTTTRDPRQESVSFTGLGIFGLFKHDGSIFDGTGALPKQNESSELGFFIDEFSYGSAEMAGEHGSSHPEQQEDAWRLSMSAANKPRPSWFSPFHCALWSPSAPPLGCSSPAERTHSRMSSPMPAEPETDDVFFTRSPVLGSPFVDGPVKRHADVAKVAMNWPGFVDNAHEEVAT
jgi:hypothetical protein